LTSPTIIRGSKLVETGDPKLKPEVSQSSNPDPMILRALFLGIFVDRFIGPGA